MKKLLILCAAALIGASSANADLVRSRTFGKKARKNNTEWIVRVGLSINNAAGSAVSEVKDMIEEDKKEVPSSVDFSAGFGPRMGGDFSVAFNKPISDKGLYWGMEMGFGSRGAKYHSKEEYKGSLTECNKKIQAWNVKYSPITFGYKYAINDNLRLDAHLGAFVSYDFAGSGATKWEDADGVYQEFGDSSYKICEGDLEGYQGLDVGLQVGVGVWFGRFNLDVTYQRGFINAFNMARESFWDVKSDAAVYSSNVMIRLGVAF